MKKIFRQIVGYLFCLPFVLMIHYLSIFIKREKAIDLVGNYITRLARGSLAYWVPYIKNSSEFDVLRTKMKGNLKLWSPIFDVSIARDNPDTFQVHVYNCPFCETCFKLGMRELSPYFCEGDWQKAERNKKKWRFERENQIGTGDNYCDHTYKRIEEAQA